MLMIMIIHETNIDKTGFTIIGLYRMKVESYFHIFLRGYYGTCCDILPAIMRYVSGASYTVSQQARSIHPFRFYVGPRFLMLAHYRYSIG